MKMICNLWCSIVAKIERFGAPIWDLLARFYLFYVFMQLGWMKFQDLLDGNWDKAVSLFRDKFNMPYPEIMAAATTIAEILFPILLLVGLCSRISALVLFAIASMLAFTHTSDITYIFWMFLSASLFLKGPGCISVDAKLCKGGAGKSAAAKSKKK